MVSTTSSATRFAEQGIFLSRFSVFLKQEGTKDRCSIRVLQANVQPRRLQPLFEFVPSEVVVLAPLLQEVIDLAARWVVRKSRISRPAVYMLKIYQTLQQECTRLMM